MPFLLEHVLVSQLLDVVRHDNGPSFFFTVAAQGSFLVLHPGRVQRDVKASVRHAMRIDTPSTQPPPPPPEPGANGLSENTAKYPRVCPALAAQPVMARLIETGRLTLEDVKEAEQLLKELEKKDGRNR